MTFSDIGKSLSNYNRCVTMKSESKIKNYHLDLMDNKNKKVIDRSRTNKSTTKEIERQSDLNEITNRNNIITNNFKKFSSIELKNDFLNIDPNNGKSTNFNILDSENSVIKVKNILRNSENKISNKDSEITINSMSISSSNNNFINLALKNNNPNSNNNLSILENNHSLEFNCIENKNNNKEETVNYDNYLKGLRNSENIFKHLSKEKNIKINNNSKSHIFNNPIKNKFVNNSSKSITDFEFAFPKSKKLNIHDTERVLNKSKYDYQNNLNSKSNSSVSDRNHFLKLRNKNINQLNENPLITSIGRLDTIEGNQINYNDFLAGNINNNKSEKEYYANKNNDVINNMNNSFDLNIKKLQTKIIKDTKNVIVDESNFKNFKTTNYNLNGEFLSSAKKKSDSNKFPNSKNFKYLNDLLIDNNLNYKENNINSNNENEKKFYFFSAEKNKLSNLNSESNLKASKINTQSFDYLSELNKQVKTNNIENSMNPALKKINNLKNELLYYTNNININKNHNTNILENINHNNLINQGNINLGSLISNTTANGQLKNSNFNFNFNFFNGPNINSQIPLQNISCNYLSNIDNLETSNLNSNENNINVPSKILDDKTVRNSHGSYLKLENLKNHINTTTNKYNFLNLNTLGNINDLNSWNNNNNFNLKTSKNKNFNSQKFNKNTFSNMMDYPITTKNKNINYFNFDESRKRSSNQ